MVNPTKFLSKLNNEAEKKLSNCISEEEYDKISLQILNRQLDEEIAKINKGNKYIKIYKKKQVEKEDLDQKNGFDNCYTIKEH